MRLVYAIAPISAVDASFIQTHSREKRTYGCISHILELGLCWLELPVACIKVSVGLDL